MKILVTGFDPFGGEPVNPAIESVKKFPNEIAGAQIIKQSRCYIINWTSWWKI